MEIKQRAHEIAHDSRLKHLEWDTKYNLAYAAIEIDSHETDESIINWILS
jgi:hypothetical protein